MSQSETASLVPVNGGKKQLSPVSRKWLTLGKATTPINIDALEVELLCHPDRRFVDNLISGLRHGFNTGITNPPTQPFEFKKMLSATKHAEDVSLFS